MAHRNSPLLIHVGLHKTGSTAIQHALQVAGLRSPLRRIEDMNATRAGEARDRGDVISSESLLGAMRTLYADASERIRRLASFGLPLHIVLFVRPIIEWHESMYVQRIQEGDAISPSEYMDAVRGLEFFRVSRLLDALLELEPNHRISILPYSSNVVRDFARVSGLGISEVRRSSNRSMPPARAVFASQINGLPAFEAKRTLRAVLQHEIPAMHPRAETTVFSANDLAAFEPATKDWLANVVPKVSFSAGGGHQDAASRRPVNRDDVLAEALAVAAHLISAEELRRTGTPMRPLRSLRNNVRKRLTSRFTRRIVANLRRRAMAIESSSAWQRLTQGHDCRRRRP